MFQSDCYWSRIFPGESTTARGSAESLLPPTTDDRTSQPGGEPLPLSTTNESQDSRSTSPGGHHWGDLNIESWGPGSTDPGGQTAELKENKSLHQKKKSPHVETVTINGKIFKLVDAAEELCAQPNWDENIPEDLIVDEEEV